MSNLAKERKEIAKKIRNIRRGKGMTQVDLAKDAKLSTNFIALIERSKKFPSLKSLNKIANALDVELSTLLKSNLKSDLDVLFSRYNKEQIIESLYLMIGKKVPRKILIREPLRD